MEARLTLLPGDGIGPEVMAEARKTLEAIAERFGHRCGSVAVSDSIEEVNAELGRDGELHWTVPSSARDGLHATSRFAAGRLAWAVPHGGGALVGASPERVAGQLAGILLAARCQVADGDGPVLPAIPVKLRRAVRKSVREAVGETSIDPRRAWACGLRTNAQCSIPGSWTSSTKRARPVSRRRSSLRGTRFPNERSGMEIL